MITWRGLALCEILGHFVFCRRNTYWREPNSPTLPQACFKRPQIPRVGNKFWWELTDSTAIDVSAVFTVTASRLFFIWILLIGACVCISHLPLIATRAENPPFESHVLLSRAVPGTRGENLSNTWKLSQTARISAKSYFSFFFLESEPSPMATVGMAWVIPAMCLPHFPGTTSSPLIEKYRFKPADLRLSKPLP